MSSSSSAAALPVLASASAGRTIIYLGMDVHKESITIAVLPTGSKAPTRLERLPNDLSKLKKWLEVARGRYLLMRTFSSDCHTHRWWLLRHS